MRSVRHPSSSLLRCPWERRSAPGGGHLLQTPNPFFSPYPSSSSSSRLRPPDRAAAGSSSSSVFHCRRRGLLIPVRGRRRGLLVPVRGPPVAAAPYLLRHGSRRRLLGSDPALPELDPSRGGPDLGHGGPSPSVRPRRVRCPSPPSRPPPAGSSAPRQAPAPPPVRPPPLLRGSRPSTAALAALLAAELRLVARRLSTSASKHLASTSCPVRARSYISFWACALCFC